MLDFTHTDFHGPGRPPALGLSGMAATSHPLATLTALDVLRTGGNAVDAAVAACAVQCVVEPQMTAIGGDCFLLYAPKGKTVIAMNGSGHAPAKATPDWFKKQGITSIEARSAHSVTVPGCVGAWSRLVADHGRKTLGELLQPAIRCAANGYPVTPRVSADWKVHGERLSHDDGSMALLMPGGKAPAAGTRHKQTNLARTLELIARKGRDAFYTGPVAEDMVRHLKRHGGLHEMDDFAAYEPEYVAPIKTAYRGYEVFECPPNGQGIIVLLILNILSGFELASLDPLGAERFHLQMEASRLAYRDRNDLIADPRKSEVPVQRLLSSDYAAELRSHIRPNRAMEKLPPSPFPTHRDTVYLSVVDQEGNAVSFINSIFDGFGAGLLAPETGVLLHSRGSSFVVDPRHPNCIGPRKRPMHTIIPGMAQKDGKTVMPFGVMGGQYQPVGQVHFFTNVVDHGMNVQKALDAPRAFWWDGQANLESGVPQATADGLAKRGHTVTRVGTPYGGGQAIWIGDDVLVGGSDPRKDGCALGF
jgi:gamma-glutamyltranspeptidase / glutathione hydrolase